MCHWLTHAFREDEEEIEGQEGKSALILRVLHISLDHKCLLSRKCCDALLVC